MQDSGIDGLYKEGSGIGNNLLFFRNYAIINLNSWIKGKKCMQLNLKHLLKMG